MVFTVPLEASPKRRAVQMPRQVPCLQAWRVTWALSSLTGQGQWVNGFVVLSFAQCQLARQAHFPWRWQQWRIERHASQTISQGVAGHWPAITATWPCVFRGHSENQSRLGKYMNLDPLNQDQFSLKTVWRAHMQNFRWDLKKNQMGYLSLQLKTKWWFLSGNLCYITAEEVVLADPWEVFCTFNPWALFMLAGADGRWGPTTFEGSQVAHHYFEFHERRTAPGVVFMTTLLQW